MLFPEAELSPILSSTDPKEEGRRPPRLNQDLNPLRIGPQIHCRSPVKMNPFCWRLLFGVLKSLGRPHLSQMVANSQSVGCASATMENDWNMKINQINHIVTL